MFKFRALFTASKQFDSRADMNQMHDKNITILRYIPDEGLADGWYEYQGVTFEVTFDGHMWKDINGNVLEPNGNGGWL